jgi:hypothetical protein
MTKVKNLKMGSLLDMNKLQVHFRRNINCKKKLSALWLEHNDNLKMYVKEDTVCSHISKPGYSDIGLCDTSSIA